MKLFQCLCITGNIRTHAVIVGILYELFAINFAHDFATLYQNEVVWLPEEAALLNTFAKYYTLVMCILMTLVTIVFWIGFLKRKRRCLSVNIFLLAGGYFPNEILQVIQTLTNEGIEDAAAEIAALIIGMYALSVVHHLRAVYLEDELEERLLDEQNEKQIIAIA